MITLSSSSASLLHYNHYHQSDGTDDNIIIIFITTIMSVFLFGKLNWQWTETNWVINDEGQGLDFLQRLSFPHHYLCVLSLKGTEFRHQPAGIGNWEHGSPSPSLLSFMSSAGVSSSFCCFTLAASSSRPLRLLAQRPWQAAITQLKWGTGNMVDL